MADRHEAPDSPLPMPSFRHEAADIISAMRAATSIAVTSQDRRGGRQSTVHKFPLAGFTANFLKLSEWCGFDANRLKKS